VCEPRFLVEQVVQAGLDVVLPPRQDLPTSLFQDDLSEDVLLKDARDLTEERPVDEDDNLQVPKGELWRPPWQELPDVWVVKVKPAV